jgi:methionyl-tRNA formyltransferase
MSSIPVLFLGTPEFAHYHLDEILKLKEFKIVGVVTQPDRPAGRKMHLQKSPVKILAEEKGIPVISPESLRGPETLEKIKNFGAEAAIVVAYGQILSQDFLNLFSGKVVNVHGSLLPRWRGAAPIQRALMAGDKVSGVSLQVVVLKLDAGDVIGESRLELPEDMNSVELHEKLKVLGVELIKNLLPGFLRGEIAPRVQDEALVTHAAKIDKSECCIDWNSGAREIHNLIRGLSMGPFAFTRHSGKTIKIHRSKIEKELSGSPGEILLAQGDELVVACGELALRILEIQPESRSKMDVRSFLAGHPMKKGNQLG